MSGPTNTCAHIIFPFPTGLYSFASIYIVSVSHACILSGKDFRISITLFASSLDLTIVVPSIFKFFIASFMPNYRTLSTGFGFSSIFIWEFASFLSFFSFFSIFTLFSDSTFMIGVLVPSCLFLLSVVYSLIRCLIFSDGSPPLEDFLFLGEGTISSPISFLSCLKSLSGGS